MEESKVYKPTEIPDTPFPQQGGESFGSTQSGTKESYSPTETKDQPIPVKKFAHEVLSKALNTKSKTIGKMFTFVESGALMIGKFVDGISGQIKISPDGIVVTNTRGETTLAVDGETGDAFFQGTLRAGTVVSGKVTVSAADGEGSFEVVDGQGNVVALLGFF